MFLTTEGHRQTCIWILRHFKFSIVQMCSCPFLPQRASKWQQRHASAPLFSQGKQLRTWSTRHPAYLWRFLRTADHSEEGSLAVFLSYHNSHGRGRALRDAWGPLEHTDMLWRISKGQCFKDVSHCSRIVFAVIRPFLKHFFSHA